MKKLVKVTEFFFIKNYFYFVIKDLLLFGM